MKRGKISKAQGRDVGSARVGANWTHGSHLKEREKTNEQKMNEAAALEGIERERAKKRQATTLLADKEKDGTPKRSSVQTTLSEPKQIQAREVIGKKIGLGQVTTGKALTVKKAVDVFGKDDAAVTAYLGLSADQLRTQLQAGKSLADIATAQGKSVERVEGGDRRRGEDEPRPGGRRREAHCRSGQADARPDHRERR